MFWTLFQRKKVTVLMYHDIDVESFEKQIEYLKSRYDIISMDTFLNFHCNNVELSRHSLVITFDDGHKRNYSLLPVIKKHNVPVTIFLCSGIVDTNRKFWFLNDLEENRIQGLKKETNNKRLSELAKIGFLQTKAYEERQALNFAEITEMSDHINFESHTVFHPILPQCSDENCKEEIENSKNDLISKYGFKIRTLAYPNGDYGQREIEHLKNAGYLAAFTTKQGYNSKKTNKYELYRFDSNDTSDINEFAVRASGLWEYLKKPSTFLKSN